MLPGKLRFDNKSFSVGKQMQFWQKAVQNRGRKCYDDCSADPKVYPGVAQG